MAAAVTGHTHTADLTDSGGTFSLSCTGSNRLLLVWVQIRHATRSVSAINYGGQALTLGIRETSGDLNATELWYLLETGIAAASNTTGTVTLSSDGINAITALALQDTAQSGTFGTFAGTTAASAALAVTVSGASGDLVAAGGWAANLDGDAASTLTAGAGVTESENYQHFSGTSSGGICVAGTAAGAASVAMTWTDSDIAGDTWTLAGVAVKPASGGAASNNLFLHAIGEA